MKHLTLAIDTALLIMALFVGILSLTTPTNPPTPTVTMTTQP